MKTRMKLLDYTLIGLLGTIAPAAWAQATAPADATSVKVRSEGEAGSAGAAASGGATANVPSACCTTTS